MLHILTCSPWKCDIDTLLRMLREGDDLLLLQDGVLAGIDKNYFVEIFKNAPITIFALKEDVKARGLTGQISSKIAVVNYTDFVNLTIRNTSQMNW